MKRAGYAIVLVALAAAGVSCQADQRPPAATEPAVPQRPDQMTPQIAFKYAWAIEQLKAAPVEQRRKVAWAARGVGADGIIPVLLLALNDSDPEVLQAAICSFTVPVRAGKVPASHFMRLLDHPNSSVRGYALAAVRYCNDPSVCDELARKMEEAAGDQRVGLAVCLASLGDARSLDVVLENFRSSQAAVYALGRINHPLVVPKLVDVLKEGPDGMSWAAAEGLARHGDRRAGPALVAALDDSSVTVGGQAAKALGELGGPQAVKALVAVLQDSKRHQNVRAAAARALGRIQDPAAMPALIVAKPAYYGDPSAEDALVMLAPRDPQLLLDGIRSRNVTVRRRCAKAAGRAGLKQATRLLVEMLRADRSDLAEDACAAAGALGQLKDERAVDALIAKLKATRNARWASARALGHIGSPRAIEPLIDGLLTDNESGCVFGTSSKPYFAALSMLGGPAAAAVIRRLQQGQERCRDRLVEALGRIGDPSAVSTLIRELSGPEDTKRSAVAALGRIRRPSGVEALIPLLKSPDSLLRAEAANALAAIGGLRAVDALLRSFEKNPSEWMCPVLAACKDQHAVPLLRLYLRTASWNRPRWAAERALGELGAPEAVQELAAALKRHRDPAAAEALGKIGGKDAAEALLAALRAGPSTGVKDALRELAVPVDLR